MQSESTKYICTCLITSDTALQIDPDSATSRRKPGTGMFLEAKNEHDLELSNCLMVGDSILDMKAGKKLGMDTMLVLTGNGEKTLKKNQDSKLISFIAKNIFEGFKQLCH